MPLWRFLILQKQVRTIPKVIKKWSSVEFFWPWMFRWNPSIPRHSTHNLTTKTRFLQSTYKEWLTGIHADNLTTSPNSREISPARILHIATDLYHDCCPTLAGTFSSPCPPWKNCPLLLPQFDWSMGGFGKQQSI